MRLGMALQMVAALVALSLVLLPKDLKADDGRDIAQRYLDRIFNTTLLAWCWAALWLTSTLFLIVIFSLGPPSNTP
jgi:hypothetical protein